MCPPPPHTHTVSAVNLVKLQLRKLAACVLINQTLDNTCIARIVQFSSLGVETVPHLLPRSFSKTDCTTITKPVK